MKLFPWVLLPLLSVVAFASHASNDSVPRRKWVEELAEVASMGMSTLHHHFRALTAKSRFNIRSSFD